MCSSRSPFVGWWYPSSGPAPPSPVVVNTIPAYFGGRPTPPSSPFRPRATPTVDDYAPCPPSPLFVPLGVEEDEMEWSNVLNPETSPPTMSVAHTYWSASELDHSTSFADPLTDETSNDLDNQVRHADPMPPLKQCPVASDHLLYARETYAYPSPILIMMQRASLDMFGLVTQPIDPSSCEEPLKIFSLTGGHTPMTGLPECDQQSLEYYNKRPYLTLLREPECFLSYRYSISSIQALQHSLCMEWSSVYPMPIPPVVIRSRDLVGPHSLSRRFDGFAFVVPAEDSIWATVCRRGVDLDYRPINPSLEIETCIIQKEDAFYFPQHIVASKFAVNVFLEIADSATRSNPLCEYLGAYVLQTIEYLTIHRTVWMDVDPEVQQDVFNRAPDCFDVYRHPVFGWPQLPYVRFLYYKWDRSMVGLADEIAGRIIFTTSEEDQGNDSNDFSNYTGSEVDTEQYCDCDVDQDTASTCSGYSLEQEYASFIDFSLCA